MLNHAKKEAAPSKKLQEKKTAYSQKSL